jgi:hypothetical protein
MGAVNQHRIGAVHRPVFFPGQPGFLTPGMVSAESRTLTELVKALGPRACIQSPMAPRARRRPVRPARPPRIPTLPLPPGAHRLTNPRRQQRARRVDVAGTRGNQTRLRAAQSRRDPWTKDLGARQHREHFDMGQSEARAARRHEPVRYAECTLDRGARRWNEALVTRASLRGTPRVLLLKCLEQPALRHPTSSNSCGVSSSQPPGPGVPVQDKGSRQP